MLVLDTSALLDALAEIQPDPALVRRLADDSDLHAPHLIDIEILHALRGLVRAGKLSPDRAEDVRTDVSDLAITLNAPLVTCDARLANAPGVNSELYPPT